MSDLSVVTFNARGLRNVTKRRTLFRYCHQHFPNHIIAVQETHSAVKDSQFWQSEWGSQILFSHGCSSNDSGVAILLPRSLFGVCQVTVLDRDDSGRLLIVSLDYDQFKITLFVVYAPTQGHSQKQVSFFRRSRTS